MSMKHNIAKKIPPSIFVVLGALSIFTVLGTYSYYKEHNCHVALKRIFLSSSAILCDNPPYQTPKHVCQPGVACTN